MDGTQRPGPMKEIGEALAIQGRVLLALMLREARTRYGRKQLGYLWALLEPAIHISLLMLLYAAMGRAAPLGHSLPMFLATGFCVFLGFRNVMKRTEGGYGSNEALLSFPIVKVMDVFIGRALLELATWCIVIFVLLTLLILWGHGGLPRSPIIMLEAVLGLFCLGVGAGIILGIAGQFYPSLSSLMSPLNRVLYFTSAVFMLPDPLPPAIRDVLAWNPVLHGVTLFRVGYYPSYESNVLDVPYLWKSALVALFLALVLEKMTRRRIRNLI